MVDTFNILDSQRGKGEVVSIGAPGAGNNASWSYSGNNLILLIGFRFLLTLDSNVAVRIVRYTLQDAGGKIFNENVSQLDNSAVSEVYTHSWGIDSNGDTQEDGTLHFDHGHLITYWVPSTFVHKITVSNIQAGDTITALETFILVDGKTQ